MVKRLFIKKWWFWATLAVVVGIVGLWFSQQSNTAEDTQETDKLSSVTLNVAPQIITTSDAYYRYVTQLTTGKVVQVKEADIFTVSDVDWNTEELVAIKFPLLSSKSITSAGISKVDNKDAYVIDVLDAVSCLPHTQDDSLRLVFVKQPSGAETLPVILRTTPNTASCDGIR